MMCFEKTCVPLGQGHQTDSQSCQIIPLHCSPPHPEFKPENNNPQHLKRSRKLYTGFIQLNLNMVPCLAQHPLQVFAVS